MRPHRLRVTAFGAFAGSEQVVFDDLEGLFLLHGVTGAGKTTLLDAIAFALYGRVPGERGSARRLRSDHASARTATEVELEATIGGRRLRVVRKPEQARPKKSGAGFTTEQASVRLDELAPDGTWESKSTRIGEVDAEIENLLGMSAAQFFQVVLLPQGEFARFLRADAKDKEALLQKLFGTDRFRRAEDWLADRRRAGDKELAAAEGEITQLVARVAQAAGRPVPGSAAALDPAELAEPAEPAAAFAGAAHRAASAPAAVSVQPGHTGDRAAPPGWEASWTAALAVAAARACDTAAALVSARKADLEAVLAAQREAEQLADRQRRRGDALRRRAQLAAATPEIERSRGAAGERARATAAGTAPDAADAPADDAGASASAVAAHVAESAALHAASRRQQAKAGRLEALRTVARQAAAEEEAAAAARARAAALAGDLDLAGAQALAHQAARPQAERERDAASRAAAALPAARAGADSARRVATDAAALVGEHAKRTTLREAHVTAREQAVAAREAALRVRAARIDGMRAELAAEMTDGSPCPVCGSLEHPDPVDSASFPPVSREAEEAAVELASGAALAAEEAASRVAATTAVIGDLARRLARVGFAFPVTGLEAAAAVPAESLDAAVLNTAVLNDVAAMAAAEAAEREAEAASLGDIAARLVIAQGQLDDLDAAIAADKARLAGLTEQHGAVLAEAAAAAARAARQRAELMSQLGEGEDLEAAIAAATELAGALGKAAAVADLLADPELDVPLLPPAPVEQATAAAEAAQRAHDEANTAYGQARHRAGQLAELRPELEAALTALQPLRERAERIRRLADLANGTSGANQYKMTLSSFVLAARLEEVAAAASERLLTMTAGRYSLVHSDARRGNAKAGLSLLACDAWTGQDRDTATLSGGETFMASLALALGLADVVTAESAGTPMEALFVDEGFGTLDEDTLDEVMNVLDGLRAGGRLVGIVSHVAELRQRVPARVHVRKSRTGSHVEVTTG